MEQGVVQGFDEHTGKLLWTTNTTEGAGYPWGEFWGYVQASAYGLFYGCGYTGIIAFNETTGAIVWHFTGPTAPAFEEPYTYGNESVYPFTSSPIVADGKIYIENNEHTPTAPYARGWGTYCVNATTGDLIWKVDNSMTVGAMSDGYTTEANSYDGSMYVFGKGQSTTTVSAPQTQITSGQNIIISGTVMDPSAAQPNTPCISEASMGAWMSYLHLQSQIPGNVTGVPVSIDAIDPNGNPVHIGDATSDMSGTFAYTWTPQMAGNYQITATFMGSNSYGSSWAETHANVVNAQTSTAPTNTQISLGQTTTDSLAMYLVVGVIAIIIAIAIIGVLLLKKK
jgi:outer membrane protein assembly factor BamB